MEVATILLYGTLGLCALLVAWLVVRYDLYEREPLPMLTLAAALGAAAMFAVGQGQVAMIRWLHGGDRAISNVEMAILAGVSEEGAKLCVVALVSLCSRRFFNEPIDGLIYGSFAGLGAALEESLAVLSFGPPTALLPMQEPVRLAGHLVMGGIGGFGIGLVVVRSRWAAPGIAICLLAAVAIHTLWDVIAFDAADVFEAEGRVHRWHTAGAIAVMLGGLVVYRKMVDAGARLAGGPRGQEPGTHSSGGQSGAGSPGG
jgi:RsiW-degrading membrane proteinase PrsW (M82 family)